MCTKIGSNRTVLECIEELFRNNELSPEKIGYILTNMRDNEREYLLSSAYETRVKVYGNKVYTRGLIEFTNHCKMDCKYCGINRENGNIHRYRLTVEEILDCCNRGYKLGFRTFVLQGGEDIYFTDDIIEDMISKIKSRYPDVAITLSIGEKDYESYERYYRAGVDRYLLRHETANEELFNRIHVSSSFKNRMRCLYDLKKIGYQVGAGFMVGIPGQKVENLVQDIMFLKKLEPEMVGIGPFIPHKDTIYKDERSGTARDTITMLALIRLFLPNVLLPATTALSSIDLNGRKQALKSGANVIMPNLSPTDVRGDYSLYDGKLSMGYEGGECKNFIEKSIEEIGLSVDMSRGDNIKWRESHDRS